MSFRISNTINLVAGETKCHAFFSNNPMDDLPSTDYSHFFSYVMMHVEMAKNNKANGKMYHDLTISRNKANLRDLIAETGLEILLKSDPNRFFSPHDLEKQITWKSNRETKRIMAKQAKSDAGTNIVQTGWPFVSELNLSSGSKWNRSEFNSTKHMRDN